jgi:hypothetical protein
LGFAIKVRPTDAQKKAAVELGRIGGKTRAANLIAEQRRRIAIKASKAAAKARSAKARQRKRARESGDVRSDFLISRSGMECATR